MIRKISNFIGFSYACSKKGSSIERIFPTTLPGAIGPYSPVTVVGNTVYISGQIPLNPKTGNIEANGIQQQTHQVMKNLKSALQAAQCSFNNVAKTTILLTDMQFFPKVNTIYAEYFQKDKYPARMCYAVKALPKGSLIEIDAIAYKQGSCKHEHI